MDEARLTTIEQLQAFLDGAQVVNFTPFGGDSERYGHISRVLKRFDYPRRSRGDKGVVLRYLCCTSGYSRAQLTRLVSQWRANRLAATPLQKRYAAPAMPFARKYTAADVALLVETDRAYEDACGAAIVHVFRRAAAQGDARFERLSDLSVAHLYNLRKSAGYQSQRRHFAKTQARRIPIGERRAPRANGQAGFVRIDTVHQGDLDGIKGVYHITCVDEVSQWQIESCVQGISEAFLLPVLALVLSQFPFEVQGFHSDNGSEYINHQVAKLLEKLRIEQTKSRSRHSNDNALAESKNASVVRRHMGYEHIPQKFAGPINQFFHDAFNPWLNMHRPCMFATESISPKGKVLKRYRSADVKTPLECLAQLDEKGLVRMRAGVTIAQLQALASAQSDLAATQAMQEAKAALFASFRVPKQRATA